MNLDERIEVEGFLRNLNIVDVPIDKLLKKYDMWCKHYRKYKPLPFEEALNPNSRMKYHRECQEYALRQIQDIYELKKDSYK